MYLWGNKTISSDDLVIVSNTRTDFQMYAAKFEGLLYNTFAENPFKNQIIIIKTMKMILLYLIIFLRILEW